MLEVLYLWYFERVVLKTKNKFIFFLQSSGRFFSMFPVMSNTTTICASKIKWNKGHGSTNATDLFGSWKAPHEIKVKSPLTGKIKTFSLDPEEAMSAEYWDGEFVILRSGKLSIAIWNY